MERAVKRGARGGDGGTWGEEWRNGVGRTRLDGMGVIAMRRGCSLTSYRDFATILLI